MSTTPKLDAVIETYSDASSSTWVDLAKALAEIREHLQRIPAPQATRYPSEAETRLIELCEQILQHYCYDLPEYQKPFTDKLAAIKRDLGLS